MEMPLETRQICFCVPRPFGSGDFLMGFEEHWFGMDGALDFEVEEVKNDARKN